MPEAVVAELAEGAKQKVSLSIVEDLSWFAGTGSAGSHAAALGDAPGSRGERSTCTGFGTTDSPAASQ